MLRWLDTVFLNATLALKGGPRVYRDARGIADGWRAERAYRLPRFHVLQLRAPTLFPFDLCSRLSLSHRVSGRP